MLLYVAYDLTSLKSFSVLHFCEKTGCFGGKSNGRVLFTGHFGQQTMYCVVPENIHTPTTEGIGNSRGVGGSMAQEIPEGRRGEWLDKLPEGQLHFHVRHSCSK